MTVGLENSIAQLEQAKSIWEKTSVPEQFTFNNQLIESIYITRWFAELLNLINSANIQENPDMAMVAIHMPGITGSCQNLQNFTQQLASNPSNPPVLQNIVNHLWSLRASLLWIMPPQFSEWENWPSRSNDLKAKLKVAGEFYDEFVVQAEEIRKQAKAFESEINSLKNILPEGSKTLQSLQQLTQDSSNAKASAEGSAAIASAEKDKVEAFSLKLNQLVEKQSDLFEHYEKRKEDIESLLEGANKVGLARSFTDRAEELKKSEGNWKSLFYLGIGLMVIVEFVGIWILPSIIDPNGKILWGSLAIRAFIISPIIWFTWFSALQYSRIMRLREDYAFKSAAAMSYSGYRREIGDDETLLNLLQEISIKNFGANPIRVLGRSDPTTPLHDLLDKALSKGVLDKGMLEKILDTVKEIIPKLK